MERNKQDWQGKNRRKTRIENDKLFQIMVGVNVFGWVVFVAALIVFHYARPEFITGAQEFWGVTVREQWSSSLSTYLVGLLFACVGLSLAVLILKRKRTRRKSDNFGVSGFILLLVALVSLFILYFEFN
ncbi:hypothetical protein [uncultured Paraglaciecola sp.]|uniref:hypothetical protein n=1 Tax=uncultured Paraglaciecola sp. TaxID=1765024 RepID=UPI0030D92BDF|tara:strand:- start:4275 stop:4661 length:387 start_codon:yes stop_codon:yes gene_type:complete